MKIEKINYRPKNGNTYITIRGNTEQPDDYLVICIQGRNASVGMPNARTINIMPEAEDK